MDEFTIDVEAINYIMRGSAMERLIAKKLKQIADNIREQAVRTGDNVPRHIHSTSLRAGMGYEHYEDDIETYLTVAGRVITGYVIANRHAYLLEFGWRDQAGNWHPPRQYMRKALRMAVDYT